MPKAAVSKLETATASGTSSSRWDHSMGKCKQLLAWVSCMEGTCRCNSTALDTLQCTWCGIHELREGGAPTASQQLQTMQNVPRICCAPSRSVSILCRAHHCPCSSCLLHHVVGKGCTALAGQIHLSMYAHVYGTPCLTAGYTRALMLRVSPYQILSWPSYLADSHLCGLGSLERSAVSPTALRKAYSASPAQLQRILA